MHTETPGGNVVVLGRQQVHKVTTWVRQVQCRVKGSGGQTCGRRDASSQKKEAERVVRTILPGGVRPHSPKR